MIVRPGFSLAEILVSMAIFVFLLGIVLFDFRSAGERERFRQAAVDLTNVLLEQQSRSLANAVPTQCACRSSCDCVPQWYGVLALPNVPSYGRIVVGTQPGALTTIEISNVAFPRDVTMHCVRTGLDDSSGDVSSPASLLVGFFPPSGRLGTLAGSVTPTDFSSFSPTAAFLYLRLTPRDLCRRISVEPNGRISYDDVACPHDGASCP